MFILIILVFNAVIKIETSGVKYHDMSKISWCVKDVAIYRYFIFLTIQYKISILKTIYRYFQYIESLLLWAPSADRRKILHGARKCVWSYNSGSKFQGDNPKNLGPKHAKFGMILDDFNVRQQMSPDRMKIFKIRQVHDLPRFLSRLVKKVWWTLVH